MSSWTQVESDFVRDHIGKMTHAQIGARLGRTRSCVKAFAFRSGFVADSTARVWTPEDREYVRQHYRKLSAGQIGIDLGRSRVSVHSVAAVMGLAIPQRIKEPGFVEFLKARHAEGWTDSEIARAKKVDRHAVSHQRKKLGLPCNALSDRRRDAVRQKTAEQLAKAGVATLGALRAAVYRQRARQAGWPEDLRERAVQILNYLWDHGPATRREIAAAIGVPWLGVRHSLHSNDPEGSYLANLMTRGLVVSLGRCVKGDGKGRNTCMYSLPLTIERTYEQPDHQSAGVD